MRLDEEIYEHIFNVYAKRKKEVKTMMTVAIFINGAPLVARSAVNQGKKNEKGEHEYLTDAGVTVYHNRDVEGGAVELAKMLLDTIDKRIC